MRLIYFSRTDPFEVAFFRMHKWCLRFLGFWPLDNLTRSTVIKICFNLSVLLLAIIGEIRFTWLIRRELIEALSAICPCLTALGVWFKLICYIIYRKELIKLLSELYEHLAVDNKDPWKKSALDETSFFNALCFMCLYFMGVGTLLGYSAKPFIVWIYQRLTGVHDTWVSLPFRVALPYEDMTQLDNKPLYTLIYILLLHSGNVIVFGFSGVGGTFLSLCMYLSVSFRFLQDDFTQTINTFTASESHLIYDKLSKLVRRHQNVLTMFNRFDKVYKFMIVGHFLSAAMVLGLASVNLLLAPGMAKSIYVIYVVGATFELYAYCYGAEKINQSCLKLSETLYFSEWYKCDVKTMKLVLLVMAKSQRGGLFSSPFFKPSLTLFAAILKTSASYITLMKEFV